MRLTLRTLLAYLDDTLEPAQAKLIGQKVAESDTAQELIARIKQVTRRRRLTVPPVTGPGSKLDPNTIAEYLDNTLSADQTAEVEQVCLGSDVHLADIAACHQILTLVLGEPVLIPPSSRQRMYGLVKGREAIPFRRPPPRAENEADESGPDLETDDTLRLGLPAYRSRGSWSSRLAVIGGGLAAALLLVLAVFEALRLPRRPDAGTSGTQIAAANSESTGRTEKKVRPGPGEQTRKRESVEATGRNGGTGAGAISKDGQTAPAKGRKQGDTAKGPAKQKGAGGNTAEKGAGKPEPPAAEVPVTPPSTKVRPVANYVAADTGPHLLLQQSGQAGTWHALDARNTAVFTAQPLVSLPGCQSSLTMMKSGLGLTLWGAYPREIFFPPVLVYRFEAHLEESRVVLHDNPELDADLTLQRGRILLNNPHKKPLRVRLRFDNPTNPELPEVWDVTLEDPGTDVLVDLWHFYPRDEPFYQGPKDNNRKGPVAYGHLIVRQGAITLRRNDKTVRLEPDTPKVVLVSWDSRQGTLGNLLPLPSLPEWASDRPGVPKELPAAVAKALLKTRGEMIAARDHLVVVLGGHGDKVDVALSSILKDSPNKAEHVLVVRCYGALDDLPNLVDALRSEDRPEARKTAIETLRRWIADGRDNDYKLLDELKTKYTRIEAENILRLLHSFSAQQAAQPEVYDFLIRNLNNPQIALRELAAWHLYLLAPRAGAKIAYGADAPVEQRRLAQAQWDRLLEHGQLPEQAPAPKGPPPGRAAARQ